MPCFAAYGWLSRGAITPSIATHNATDAVGIALTPQAPGLGGIHHLHRFGLQLSFALKNQVINKETCKPAARLLIQQQAIGFHIPQLGEPSV